MSQTRRTKCRQTKRRQTNITLLVMESEPLQHASRWKKRNTLQKPMNLNVIYKIDTNIFIYSFKHNNHNVANMQPIPSSMLDSI